MKLSDIDQTVGEYFSRDFTSQMDGGSPEGHMNGIYSKSPFFLIANEVSRLRRSGRGEKKSVPYEVPDDTISIMESRVLAKEEVPLRFFGTFQEISEKEFCAEAMNETICDRCGRKIERYPWMIIKNTGSLCDKCFQDLEDSVRSARAILRDEDF